MAEDFTPMEKEFLDKFNALMLEYPEITLTVVPVDPKYNIQIKQKEKAVKAEAKPISEAEIAQSDVKEAPKSSSK